MPSLVPPRVVTADELFSMPADGYRYELIAGELRMMSPAGGRHGRISGRIALLLAAHVDEHQLGVVYAAGTGFLIDTDPDTVLAPDVAFLKAARYRQVEDEIHYLPLAPDLAVEVLSPSDRFTRVETKAFAWIDAGTRLVLLVDPDSETVHAYRSRKQIEVFQKQETVDCSDAVDGWKFLVADAFRVY